MEKLSDTHSALASGMCGAPEAARSKDGEVWALGGGRGLDV